MEHGRNVTDEQIRASAATGGVICVSGVSIFLGNPAPTAVLADALQHTGMSAEEAALVMGGNMMRVAGAVWGSGKLPP